ncbi:hypothetical protein [Actinomadura soli]|uniref:hypothetical protein n=1 Tax=Actinomadura soli TaxID=2508997 RepID=UPI00148616DD|nr:hypothetical protein [Actinomadura soli]
MDTITTSPDPEIYTDQGDTKVRSEHPLRPTGGTTLNVAAAANPPISTGTPRPGA